MPKDLPMISYKRKYIIFFLKMCPSETLRAFLTNRVILPDDYRKLAIRRTENLPLEDMWMVEHQSNLHLSLMFLFGGLEKN